MTLDIPQFIANSVRTQSKIHHLDINVKAVEVSKIPASVKKLITDDYGEKYLDDSDYVAFFWGPIDKDSIDKLFNTVDKALGKSANKLTDKDFKKISLSSDSSNEDADEQTEDIEVDTDEETTEKSEDLDNEEIDDTESIEDDEDSDEQNDEEDDEKSSEDELNEDKNEDDESIDVKIEEKPETPTSYFFLKITSK